MHCQAVSLLFARQRDWACLRQFFGHDCFGRRAASKGFRRLRAALDRFESCGKRGL